MFLELSRICRIVRTLWWQVQEIVFFSIQKLTFGFGECIFKIQFHERSNRHKRNPKIRTNTYIFTVYSVIDVKNTKNDWNNNFFSFYTKNDKNMNPCYSKRTYTCLLGSASIDLNIISCSLFKYSDTVIDKLHVVINHNIIMRSLLSYYDIGRARAIAHNHWMGEGGGRVLYGDGFLSSKVRLLNASSHSNTEVTTYDCRNIMFLTQT